MIESIEPEYDDEENDASLSGSARNSSGPDEAVFDDTINMTGNSSPRTSHHSDDEISDFPTNSRVPSCALDQQGSSPYTTLKTRSPFRNPSSVQAIQLDTTPPPYLTSPPPQQRCKLQTPSRNSTPRSARSFHSTARSPSKIGPTKKVKKEYPLVLLHVTLMPISWPYSQETMEDVLPGYIIENWKMLREKATDTVLERGILIPHPKEDYDLLEERLLESLELSMPRILKCGHFHTSPDEAEDGVGSEAEGDESDEDADICGDCGRRIRDGRFGSGTGNRRWDIKIYAANGLMRAGAWGAAWREMERVDVEILPWIGEDMKRELDSRRAEEARHVPEPLHDDHEEYPQGTPKEGYLDNERLREIYGDDAQAYVDGLTDEMPPLKEESRTRHATQSAKARQSGPSPDVPLWVLLRNYIYLASQDRRNIAILLLGSLVIYLSLKPQSSPVPLTTPPQIIIPTPVARLAEYGLDAATQACSSITSAIMPTPLSSMISSLSADDDLVLE